MKEVPLAEGKYGRLVALVDDEDFSRVSKFRWYAEPNRYTYYCKTPMVVDGKKVPIRLHKFILGHFNRSSVKVDHVNGNGLDCRRENLREVTNRQNLANKPKRRITGGSVFKGVSWNKRAGKWAAGINVEGVRKQLGLFTEEVEAAKAYDKAACVVYGDYAWLNFPPVGRGQSVVTIKYPLDGRGKNVTKIGLV